MASISFGGLVSGLDTGAIIDSLMNVEALPQTLLKNKVTAQTQDLTAMRALNTKLSALVDAAKAAAKPDAFSLYTATSSDKSVTVTTSKEATAGTFDVAVEAASATHTVITDSFSEWPDWPAVISITGHNGESVEFNASGRTPQDIANAINLSGAGVVATPVRVGVDSGTGQPLYRIQLTSKTPGAEGQFTISRGSVADGTAVDLESEGATVTRAGQDAAVVLWKGTPAEERITSATGTFDDIMPGVDLTVGKDAVGTSSTITVSADATGRTNVAKGVVDALNAVLSTITSYTTVTTSTGSDGSQTTTAGVLTSDPTTRSVRDSLLDAISDPAGGISLATFGIELTKDGAVTFDPDAFKTALTDDPDGAQEALQKLAEGLAKTSDSYADSTDGVLTKQIESGESVLKDLSDQVSAWDTRLADRRAQLTQVYSQLEVTLSQLNGQASMLAAQLGTLSTSTGSK